MTDKARRMIEEQQRVLRQCGVDNPEQYRPASEKLVEPTDASKAFEQAFEVDGWTVDDILRREG